MIIARTGTKLGTKREKKTRFRRRFQTAEHCPIIYCVYFDHRFPMWISNVEINLCVYIFFYISNFLNMCVSRPFFINWCDLFSFSIPVEIFRCRLCALIRSHFKNYETETTVGSTVAHTRIWIYKKNIVHFWMRHIVISSPRIVNATEKKIILYDV